MFLFRFAFHVPFVSVTALPTLFSSLGLLQRRLGVWPSATIEIVRRRCPLQRLDFRFFFSHAGSALVLAGGALCTVQFDNGESIDEAFDSLIFVTETTPAAVGTWPCQRVCWHTPRASCDAEPRCSSVLWRNISLLFSHSSQRPWRPSAASVDKPLPLASCGTHTRSLAPARRPAMFWRKKTARPTKTSWWMWSLLLVRHCCVLLRTVGCTRHKFCAALPCLAAPAIFFLSLSFRRTDDPLCDLCGCVVCVTCRRSTGGASLHACFAVHFVTTLFFRSISLPSHRSARQDERIVAARLSQAISAV